MVKIKEAKVLGIIQKALNLKGKKVTIDMRIGAVEEWDSLGHLGILAALDKAFKGRVAGIKEMASADSVKKIIALLRKNSLI